MLMKRYKGFSEIILHLDKFNYQTKFISQVFIYPSKAIKAINFKSMTVSFRVDEFLCCIKIIFMKHSYLLNLLVISKEDVSP